jgi:aspartyl-tRNA synthetase
MGGNMPYRNVVPIVELSQLQGEVVTLRGWVQTIRNQKRMQFLVLRDATGLVQITHERGQQSELEELINNLTVESTVEVIGQVVLNPSVKLGGLEVMLEKLTVYSVAETLPIDNATDFDKRMDYRWVDLRSPQNRLIFELQTAIEYAMRKYWAQQGFIEIHSPKLMGAPSESGAELFNVPYFGGMAYLAQSPQFYKQMAMASGFDRVFEIGPVFRANPSFTSRHDTEFTSVDVEMSWIESHEDVMNFEEAWIAYFMHYVAEEFGPQIADLFGMEVVVPELPFPRLPMSEAAAVVRSTGYIVPPETKGDLDPQAERLVAQYVQEHYGHEFVFVTEYPASVRAFYHMRPEGKPNLTKSFDLLYKGLEVTTGAQREHRYDQLLAQALEKGLKQEAIQFYLDFFRYGMPPHGGYGFGLTRLLMKLLGLENVRQVTYLYRGPNRLNP